MQELQLTQGKPATGRNLRNVWAVSPRGFPDAHFATFPEALVRPCIQAGTSERGACPECGAQWARVVERTTYSVKGTDKMCPHVKHVHETGFHGGATAPSGLAAPGWRKEKPRSSATTGWAQSCDCCGFREHMPTPIPATVLDSFAGSGTTGLVACKLGRSFVGIELNPEYADMARRRMGGDLLFGQESQSA